VCETPCSVTVNPADGGSTHSRSFVLRRDGYLDETVTVDLDKPPKQLEVDLKREPKPEPEPKKKGFKEETVAIDLADPPHEVRVSLDKEEAPPPAVKTAIDKPKEKKREVKKQKVDGKTTFNPFEE